MANNARRNFLSKIGTLGLTAIVPSSNLLKAKGFNPIESNPTACTILPAETRGPFPLFQANQIASQTALVRSDIRETQTGVPLTLTITVQNQDCIPIPDAKVYIWHCSKNGLYSGYSNNMNPGQAGLTYLRGIQVSDNSGQVTFQTVYPGWYNGRLTHIHVEVYVSNVLILTSQFAFPLDSVSGTETALVNAVYGNNNNNITSYSGDNVFNNGYDTQLLTFTGDTTNGYTSNHVFTMAYTVTPLSLISFTAGVQNKNPMLWWITAHEQNVKYFEIEQSTHPSKNYENIGAVIAKNSTTESHYSFSLPTPLPADITYFRLKITDNDGKVHYSEVANIHLQTVEELHIKNSIVTNELFIQHPATFKNSYVKIINLQGQLLGTGQLSHGVRYTKMNVSFLCPGHYIAIIENGIDKLSAKFIKQ